MKNIFNKAIKHLHDDGFLETVKWLIRGTRFRVVRYFTTPTSKDFIGYPLSKKINKNVINKKSVNVFVIASIPYYDIGGGQRCSQLAKTFNKMGFNVNYLYAFPSSEKKELDITMPISSHIFIDDKTIIKLEKLAKKNDLFIFEAPSIKFDNIIDFAIEKECKIIYENIDNWETSLGKNIYDEKTLIKLLTNADLLTGTAKPLVEQLKGYLKKYKIDNKEVIYSANAVDEELFCGLKSFDKPKDLITGKITLLYYGTLWGEWFDWDLLIGLAKKNKDYQINLIGDASNVKKRIKNWPDNIHFLGQKAQGDLPSYLNHCDFTLLPFKPGNISDYVSPLKIFEYISMYTRVLCTELKDVKGYPNVYLGSTVDDFDKIIKKNPKVSTEDADDFIGDNTWFNRIDTMLTKIYSNLSDSKLKNKLSIVILNYNNGKIIFKSINSLLKYNKNYNYKIIIVDNGSSDGSYEKLLKEYKENHNVEILKNVKNGCSSGRNLGVSNCSTEYILFLDSDQWVTNKHWLYPYECILNDENIGLIGWAAGFFNKSKRAYHVVDSFPFRYMPPTIIARNDIGYLGSGGMLIKREDFEKIDGFDINYDPTCYEDTDLSLKVRNMGKEIYYCPYLGIIHLPHQTTNSGSPEHDALIKQKQEYFTNKWTEKNIDLLKMYIK